MRDFKDLKIAVAGTGFVCLSLSVLLAQHNQVMAVDIVQAKVDMINNHKSPIQDDYIEKYLAEKELIDKYGKLPEQLITQNGTYRIKYLDEFNKQYDKYESLLVRLSGKNVDELFS